MMQFAPMAPALVLLFVSINLTETCTTTIYTQNTLFDHAAAFAGIFGAIVLFNIFLAETLSVIPTLTEAICRQSQSCIADLLTDALNSGGCGNVVSLNPFSHDFLPR
jgi:hypothetical protein